MDNLFFQILVEFGLPVASATVMGVFIYIILKYILDSVIGQVNSIHGIIMGLDNRIKTMNNDMIKLDLLISHALNIASAVVLWNFVRPRGWVASLDGLDTNTCFATRRVT